MRARLTIKIGGQKRLLKFNLATMKRYDADAGQDGAALQLVTLSPMIGTLSLTKYALDFPGNENNLPEDLTDDLLADWIDELPDKNLEQLTNTLLLSIKKFGDAFAKGSAIEMMIQKQGLETPEKAKAE